MRALVTSGQTGYDNLEQVTGEDVTLLLTRFGITLWADGRIWNSLTSWNIYDIFENLVAAARLQPYASASPEPSIFASASLARISLPRQKTVLTKAKASANSDGSRFSVILRQIISSSVLNTAWSS